MGTEYQVTEEGMLIPNLTTAERDAISTPTTGLQIYNTTTGQYEAYDGSIWNSIEDPIRTRRYLLSTRFRVGMGAGAAADGQIADVPVVLYNDFQDQEADLANHIIPEVDLSSVDPQLVIHHVATGAAGVGTETVRLQVDVRYRADGEDVAGAYDETFTIDHDITTGVANVHGHITIDLDRSLITSEDLISLKVTRLGTHLNDDYPNSWGISQIWLVHKGTGGT